MHPSEIALSALKVHPESMVAKAQPTARDLKVKVNYFQQRLLKHSGKSEFHSLHELYYAVLLESDPEVIQYTPQPYRFRIGQMRYTPDFEVHRASGVELVELKTDRELDDKGQWDTPKARAMDAFCQARGWRFVVVANSWVKQRQALAQRWLPIVRVLARQQACATDPQEQSMLQRLARKPYHVFQDLVDLSDRAWSYLDEIALFRLAHRGVVSLGLSRQPLHPNSRVCLR
ncbi:MAG: hypothetical protein HWE16_05475 [Gammaproteobacteria bacterium]|nr:hypothetical protein [Gammaproteobacteria bacterium]